MLDENLQRLAQLISQNRRNGIISDLPFEILQTEEEAWAVQSSATSTFADDTLGYAVIGNAATIRNSLGIQTPIYGAIPVGTCLGASDRPFRLPQGIIGAQCDLVFTLGASLGADRIPITREKFCASLLTCQPAVSLVGRRGHLSGEPQLAAIADFAFHTATIVGNHHEAVDLAAFDRMSLGAAIDGNEVLHVQTGRQLIDPIASALWLIDNLIRKGLHLGAGDIIATGSLAPILLQVLPGQELQVEVSEIGNITVHFA